MQTALANLCMSETTVQDAAQHLNITPSTHDRGKNNTSDLPASDYMSEQDGLPCSLSLLLRYPVKETYVSKNVSISPFKLLNRPSVVTLRP